MDLHTASVVVDIREIPPSLYISSVFLEQTT